LRWGTYPEEYGWTPVFIANAPHHGLVESYQENNIVRIYDIYHSKAIKAYLCIQDDGQKKWDFSSDEWNGFWWGDDSKTAIEQAVEQYPNEDEFTFSVFAIQRRPA
jgi:hypothetical protein